MSQHDYVIDNAGGAAVRADINAALAAVKTQNSGTTAPSVTAPFMLWYDTTSNELKIRNAADTAWVSFLDVNGVSKNNRMPYVAGRYYTAPFNMRAQQGGSLTVAANTLYLIPYRQEITGSMAALSIAIGTAVAGNVRLGLYSDSAGVPGSLIATAGTASTTASGIKDVAYTSSIPAGNYWLAAQFDAAPSVNVYDGTLSSPQVEAVLGLPGGANFTLDFYLGYSVAATYASGLPASITSPTLIYKVPVIAAKA